MDKQPFKGTAFGTRRIMPPSAMIQRKPVRVGPTGQPRLEPAQIEEEQPPTSPCEPSCCMPARRGQLSSLRLLASGRRAALLHGELTGGTGKSNEPQHFIAHLTEQQGYGKMPKYFSFILSKLVTENIFQPTPPL